MVKDNLYGRMVKGLLETGLKANRRGLELMYYQINFQNMDYGMMVNEYLG